MRRPSGLTEDLDVGPAHAAANAGPECLADGLLTGQRGGQAIGIPGAVVALAARVEARSKPVAGALELACERVDVDDVHSHVGQRGHSLLAMHFDRAEHKRLDALRDARGGHALTASAAG